MNINKQNNLNIAYVGNFLNHGVSLSQFGTGLCYLLSKIEKIKEIDVICPKKDNLEDDININKIKILEEWDNKDLFSFKNVIKRIYFKKYDIIIFNINPTSFSDKNIINLFGLILTLIIKIIFKKRVIIIYHNSAFTSNIEKLGYNSFSDKIKYKVLLLMETLIFKNIETFFTLKFYKEIVDKKIKKSKVKYLNFKYIEAIPTIILNNLENEETFDFKKSSKVPNILLFGYWGPQKNLELILNILKRIDDNGYKFNLTIAGGVNIHFKNYKMIFKKLIEKNKDIINELKGYVNEKDILNLFLKTDILILPYTTPGGWSAILDQAAFFDLTVAAIEFPEYIEQANNYNNKNIYLIKDKDLEDFLINFIKNFKNNENKKIYIKYKIEEGLKSINKIIEKIIEGE